MSQIGALTSFTANTPAVASQVNANFNEIKTKVNTYCAFLDAASQTFTGIVIVSGALTASTGFTVTAGGLTVTAGGLTVTAGGLTVTADGITVTAGNLVLSGGQASAKRVDHSTTGNTETLDFNQGNIHKIVLDQNCTLTLSNPVTGAYYTVEVVYQGSFEPTWPATVKPGGGGTFPTYTKTNGRKDIFVLYYNGTNYDFSVFDMNFVETA